MNIRAFVAAIKNSERFYDMLPDYPHKIFADKRTSYTLLMKALAMDTMR